MGRRDYRSLILSLSVCPYSMPSTVLELLYLNNNLRRVVISPKPASGSPTQKFILRGSLARPPTPSLGFSPLKATVSNCAEHPEGWPSLLLLQGPLSTDIGGSSKTLSTFSMVHTARAQEMMIAPASLLDSARCSHIHSPS